MPASISGIEYMVVLSDIDKVTSVNLQKGNKGEVGNVVVNLFNSTKPKENIKGILVSENFTEKDRISGFFPANPNQENFYVNVITTDHTTGELRGQLKWILSILRIVSKIMF